MADVSEVTATLAGICAGLIYPNGTGSSTPSICGVDAYIFPGWPVPKQFEDAAQKKRCIVSVYPWAGERNTTRYLEKWRVAGINTPTLTATASGLTVTLAGTIPPPTNRHNIAIFVNRFPYVYGVQSTDTLNTIAAALSTLIGVNVPGTINVGSAVMLPQGANLGAVRVGVTGSSVLEIKRQEKQFRIIIWANSPQNRTALAKALDRGLAAFTFINLPDLTAGRIRYHNNWETDNAQKQLLYRRDLIYTVEYGTILSQTNPQIIVIELSVGSALGPTDGWGASDAPTPTMDTEVETADSEPAPTVTVYE